MSNVHNKYFFSLRLLFLKFGLFWHFESLVLKYMIIEELKKKNICTNNPIITDSQNICHRIKEFILDISSPVTPHHAPLCPHLDTS